MMYCRHCGEQMDPNAAICVKCGYAKGTGNEYCQNCGQAVTPGAAVCVSCGASLNGANAAVGEQKSKLVAVLLCFFLGSIGIHDFYLGYTKYGVIKIVLACCTAGTVSGIWALIDFVRLLIGSIHTDANGVELKKEF